MTWSPAQDEMAAAAQTAAAGYGASTSKPPGLGVVRDEARGPDLKHFTCAQRVFNPTVPSMVQIGTPTKRLLNPLYSEGWLWRSMVTWSDMRVSDHGITRLYQCSPNFSMEQVFCIEFGRWFSKLGYGQLWTIWSSTWSSGGVCYRFLILLMGMPRTLTDGCVKTSTNFGGANAQVGWIS